MLKGLLKFGNLISLFNNDTCKRFLKEQRWGDDVVCPYCGQHQCYTCSDGRFHCPHCNCNFSVTVGTIFDNTKLPLVKWFAAMYLVSSHKKGISSMQLSRDIAVSEAFIGGTGGKWTFCDKVIAQKVKEAKSSTLSPIIRQFVKPGSHIYTDDYIGYNSLYDSEYTHSVVRHYEKEFVSGDAHTNTIEGFWGQLKRMIFGIYHFVSAKYLQRYVDEAVFRYNTQKMTESERFEEHVRQVRPHRQVQGCEESRMIAFGNVLKTPYICSLKTIICKNNK